MTDWHKEETYKSLIQISTSALRFVLFANGGAAIAVLAFLGSAWGKPTPDVAIPLGLFLGGVFFGGLAHVGAYLTQLVLYNKPPSQKKPKLFSKHETWLSMSIFFVIAGILMFGAGSMLGVLELSK